MNTSIRAGLVLLAAAATLQGAWAQTADEIIEKSKNISSAKTTMIQMVITTKDKAGASTEMAVEQYGVDEKGVSKSVIEFKKPANIAGTRFLVIEVPGGEEDRKIWLPELGKVRRIGASEGGGSFMGTDFTYDDISSTARETNRDTHTIAGEETLGGKACWVIESVPKKTGDGQYSRSKRWIAKDGFLTLKTEAYDKAGKLLKVIDIGEYQTVNGYLTPMDTTVKNVQEGTSTAMVMKKVIYDKAIPAGVFTEKYLKTGRP